MGCGNSKILPEDASGTVGDNFLLLMKWWIVIPVCKIFHVIADIFMLIYSYFAAFFFSIYNFYLEKKNSRGGKGELYAHSKNSIVLDKVDSKDDGKAKQPNK